MYGVVKKNRRKTYRNVDHQTYRFTRERTSTSQSQMLWTFLVAIAVAMIGLLNMKTSATKTSQVDPLPSRQPAQVLLSPAPNKSEAPRLEDHTS